MRVRFEKLNVARPLLKSWRSWCFVVAALFAIMSASVLRADPKSGDKPASGGATNSETTNLSASPGVATNGTNAGLNMETLDDKHKLAIGDKLSFRIVEDEDPPQELTVMDSGDLEVPLIGRFPAVGMSCKKMAQTLKAEFEKQYYYHATVILAVDVMSKTRGRVYVVGTARSGPVEIPSDEDFTLSKAIMLAGGLGDYSDGSKVRVTRKSNTPGAKDKEYVVDVEKILEKGKRDGDMILEPDDLIYVPEKHFRM